MPFTFNKLDIPEIILIEPKVFSDPRGFFMEMYKHSDFKNMGIQEHFVQDNFSRSQKNILRGLHFQKNPNAQGKLVQCLKGKIFDVTVDIRKGSPSFSQWISVELSEENKRKKPIFLPIRVDDAVLGSDQVWAEYINKTRNICDFSNWKDHDDDHQALENLLNELKISG